MIVSSELASVRLCQFVAHSWAVSTNAPDLPLLDENMGPAFGVPHRPSFGFYDAAVWLLVISQAPVPMKATYVFVPWLSVEFLTTLRNTKRRIQVPFPFRFHTSPSI